MLGLAVAEMIVFRTRWVSPKNNPQMLPNLKKTKTKQADVLADIKGKMVGFFQFRKQ